MFKKIIYLGIGIIFILIITLTIFTVTKNDYIYKEGDFRLSISVNKTQVRPDDEVEVTVSLTNLSGRNVRIKMSSTIFKSLESMLFVGLFEQDEEPVFMINLLGGRRIKRTIKKGTTISRTIKRSGKSLDYPDLTILYAFASVDFYVEKDFKKRVSFDSERVIITIKSTL